MCEAFLEARGTKNVGHEEPVVDMDEASHKAMDGEISIRPTNLAGLIGVAVQLDN